MMSPEKIRAINEVYLRFMDSEEDAGWDVIDDHLQHLEYLDDLEIVRESEIQTHYHSFGKIKCQQETCDRGCFAQSVCDAVTHILDFYKVTNELNVENRYVLENYLALSKVGMIISDAK